MASLTKLPSPRLQRQELLGRVIRAGPPLLCDPNHNMSHDMAELSLFNCSAIYFELISACSDYEMAGARV